MAREDILPQLIRELMKKEGPPPQDDNTILQKMVIPQDQLILADVEPTVKKQVVADEKWGGEVNGQQVVTGWSWNLGQWR